MASDKSSKGSGVSPPRLAWIGLGNMGRGMVKNLVEKGEYSGAVAIQNRTIARAEKLASSLPSGKTKVVTSVSDAVKGADYIFICVANDAALDETIAAALEEPESKGKLFIDCSTVHPDKTNEIAEKITAAGAEFVACPVFGAPAMADAGQLICVLAGSATQVDKVLPYCKGVMGRTEINFSNQPHGAASRLKIVGNTMILMMVESLAESHVLAEKSGLGVDNLHAFIEQIFPGPYTAYSNRLRTGDYYKREEPAFQASLAQKDANHAQSLAHSCGVKMRGVEVCQQHLDQVVEYAADKGDIAGIYGAVRKESGLSFEN